MKTEKKFIANSFSYESKENMETVPYIRIIERPRKGFYSFFGIKIESVFGNPLIGSSEASNFLYEQIKLIQCLFGMPEQSMELRYTAWPAKENSKGGRIDIVLIGRVISQTHAEASLDAMACWKNLSPFLKAEAGVFELSPIISEAELQMSLNPFDVNDIAEITRREEMIPLNRKDQLYYPCPFIPTYATMSRLCKGLLAHEAPSIFSVLLQPVRLTQRERFYVENPVLGAEAGFLAKTDTKALNKSLSGGNNGSGSKSTYLMKVHVASSVVIPSYLLDLIGSEITAPSPGYDVNTGPSGKNSYGGGYSWYKPETKDAFDAALSNMAYHEFHTWAPTFAADDIKRLRYIYDAVQANAAFRLPIPTWNEEIQGIKIKHGVPLIPLDGSNEGLALGMSRYGTIRATVKLDYGERRKHCYIQGATGTGKTTLILNMALEDIHRGKGVLVVDFHGDLSIELLKRLPKGRLDDIVYFNPADIEYPIGFNPLGYDAYSPLKDLLKERIVSTIMTWLRREFKEETMGPIFYQNIRNALFLAMSDDDEPATLIDLVNLFYDQDFLKKRLEKLKNPMLRKFWTDAYNPAKYKNISDGASMLMYVISKFSPFVDSDMMRNIFGQGASKMDVRESMDSSRILVCNFSKGLLGEHNAKFLGLMMLSKIEQAALSRADISEDKRVDCFVYLDECQNLQTEHLYNMLSEMRKYRINITLANQHFSQLDEKMRDAITSNCGTIVVFRNGVKDADLLEPMFTPYSKQMIMRLANYQAAARMSVNGSPKVFTLDTLPLIGKEDVEILNTAVNLSRRRYGMRVGVKPTDTVDKPEGLDGREAVQNN